MNFKYPHKLFKNDPRCLSNSYASKIFDAYLMKNINMIILVFSKWKQLSALPLVTRALLPCEEKVKIATGIAKAECYLL